MASFENQHGTAEDSHGNTQLMNLTDDADFAISFGGFSREYLPTDVGAKPFLPISGGVKVHEKTLFFKIVCFNLTNTILYFVTSYTRFKMTSHYQRWTAVHLLVKIAKKKRSSFAAKKFFIVADPQEVLLVPRDSATTNPHRSCAGNGKWFLRLKSPMFQNLSRGLTAYVTIHSIITKGSPPFRTKLCGCRTLWTKPSRPPTASKLHPRWLLIPNALCRWPNNICVGIWNQPCFFRHLTILVIIKQILGQK